TVVAAPDGRFYVNKTGNQGLAQAGSGDVLAGMVTAMLGFVQDPFEAACMAVFAHGMAADELAKEHSMQQLPLEKIPEVMDKLFFEKGF
ncbi:MAG: bifunctional ADP-dependent NAD(P)H-hydrate dehydratase/NAD(P)H-hydrate epimerase, partial [Firmicutes bacterium]|nr:bifunctional ADP-dependent NAD(P)H-hydrate dehydratase/NAD(P)H-hydrate epimerase [Bacillota bacterium]